MTLLSMVPLLFLYREYSQRRLMWKMALVPMKLPSLCFTLAEQSYTSFVEGITKLPDKLPWISLGTSPAFSRWSPHWTASHRAEPHSGLCCIGLVITSFSWRLSQPFHRFYTHGIKSSLFYVLTAQKRCTNFHRSCFYFLFFLIMEAFY